MLDIDFLSAARPSLRQHAVYMYSSGLLRGPVRIRLEQLYEACFSFYFRKRTSRSKIRRCL
jgi:hypothetical protein